MLAPEPAARRPSEVKVTASEPAPVGKLVGSALPGRSKVLFAGQHTCGAGLVGQKDGSPVGAVHHDALQMIAHQSQRKRRQPRRGKLEVEARLRSKRPEKE